MRVREKRGRRQERAGGRARGGGSRLWKAGAGSCLADKGREREREREREKQEMERAGYSCTLPFCVGLKKTFHWRDLRDSCS